MRRARRHRIECPICLWISGQHPVPFQQVRQGQQTKAHAGFFEKLTPVGELLITTAMLVKSRHTALSSIYSVQDRVWNFVNVCAPIYKCQDSQVGLGIFLNDSGVMRGTTACTWRMS